MLFMTTGDKWARREAGTRDGREATALAHRPGLDGFTLGADGKLVETKWNLPALTRRDANANDMLDMLDLTSPAFSTPPPLARPLLDTDSSALACNSSGPGTIPPPGSVVPLG
jgi:hypothetical protein